MSEKVMNFKVLKEERLLDEFITVDKVQVEHDQFNHVAPANVCRYNIERPQAVAVILENTTTGALVLVEQFRYATVKHNKKNGWVLEIIAGLLDEGETPEACGMRETLEETGYKVDQLEFIHTYYGSVGISTEQIHLFYGQVSTSDKVEKGGGLVHEHEDLAIREIPYEDLIQRLKKGEIIDSKTILGLQWLMLKKQGLLD